MTHPEKISLFKYFLEPLLETPDAASLMSREVEALDPAQISAHLRSCTQCADYGVSIQRLIRTLSELSGSDLKPTTACPDSWSLAAYIHGDIDQDEKGRINAHIAFCDKCLDAYLALADEQEIARLFLDEETGTSEAPRQLDTA
jgi:predicted anti-sigma-YlaC factor YlaD